ncbi:MAG: hypothetical protein QM791_22910 [Ferruginibacter sp.]
MKQFTITLCTALFAFAAFTVFAQKAPSTQPHLFKNYPAVIDFSEAQLNSLFSAKPGQNKTLALQGGLSLNGPVVSNVVKYKNLQTVAIKLTAFNNMLFALSKRTEKDNSVVYVGHLFSKDYADGYELKRTANNTYQLVKVDMNEILPTCNQ